jgi:hypothetical protein
MKTDEDDILSPEGGIDDEFGGLAGEVEGLGEPTAESLQMDPEAEEKAEGAKASLQPVEGSGGRIGRPRKASTPKEAGKAKPKSQKREKTKKPEKKLLTRRERAIGVMLRRAGKDSIPSIEDLMRGKDGKPVAIKDIALFIDANNGASSELMAELATECPLKNRVNLSAEVMESRVLYVGAQILRAGRMYIPIQVVKIREDGALECVSGRHRLAFLALVYGADTKIPVHIENMSLSESRDAVVVANEARPTKALERAEHTVLQAVGGNVDTEQDELYQKTVKTRSTARKYCVYNMMKRRYPAKLAFKVSQTSSRRDGGLTTLTNIENFWGAALDWNQELGRKEFDAMLKDSVKFLNELAEEFANNRDFDEDSHMASMTMIAIGKYYRAYSEIMGRNAIEVVRAVAKQVVKMGDIGRQKSEKTYKELSSALKSK